MTTDALLPCQYVYLIGDDVCTEQIEFFIQYTDPIRKPEFMCGEHGLAVI